MRLFGSEMDLFGRLGNGYRKRMTLTLGMRVGLEVKRDVQ